MPEVSVPWGPDELKLILPEHWKLQQVAVPQLRPAPDDWPERLAMAMNQPCAGAPLSKLLAAHRGERIVLVVEDITRHSPLPAVLEVVLREIRHARIAPGQLGVVFGTGMHPPMTPAQAAAKLGPAAEELSWRSNPWADKAAYVSAGSIGKVDVRIDRGVATAGLRILISSVAPHLQAGFGGGYKMLLPGCAHIDTILALHRLGVGRTPRQLVGTEAARNPMRQTIDAGGRLIDAAGGESFAVQYLLDGEGKPAFVAAGPVIPTQRMLAKQCSVACGIATTAPADVIITNAHPLDFDLWQSFKCIANTRWAVRRNGLIICLTRCTAGLNDMKLPAWPISPTWTRRLVRLLGADGLSSLLSRLVPNLAGDAAFFARLATQTLYRNPIFMVSPTLHASGVRFPGIQLFGDVAGAVRAADALTHGEPQRLVVFPAGGVTFPVPTPAAPLGLGPGARPARSEA